MYKSPQIFSWFKIDRVHCILCSLAELLVILLLFQFWVSLHLVCKSPQIFSWFKIYRVHCILCSLAELLVSLLLFQFWVSLSAPASRAQMPFFVWVFRTSSPPDFLSLFSPFLVVSQVISRRTPLKYLRCLYIFTDQAEKCAWPQRELGMGTIPIPSIDTVDTCEFGASIDTSIKYR